MKYAVYVVVIEDTSSADMDLSGQVEVLERADADMEYDEAEVLMRQLAQDARA